MTRIILTPTLSPCPEGELWIIRARSSFENMSQGAAKLRLEDLDIKPYQITKLKMAGIESVFDLAISIPHQLIDVGGVNGDR